MLCPHWPVRPFTLNPPLLPIPPPINNLSYSPLNHSNLILSHSHSHSHSHIHIMDANNDIEVPKRLSCTDLIELVEVRASWSGHPKLKNKNKKDLEGIKGPFDNLGLH